MFRQHSLFMCCICISKNTEIKGAAVNDMGLDVNADKTKYCHVSKAQYKDWQ